MNDEEYLFTQNQLSMIAGIVDCIDVDAFLHRIEMAEAAAPIVDPTLWIKGADSLGDVRRLARSFLPLKETIAALKEKGAFSCASEKSSE